VETVGDPRQRRRTDAGFERQGPNYTFRAVDMLGNIWEWCSPYEGSESQLRPIAIQSSEAMPSPVFELRGGSYLDNLSRDDLALTLPFCSVSWISNHDECRHSDLGFRVAATVPIGVLPEDVAERVRRRFDLTPPPESPWTDTADSYARRSYSPSTVGASITAGASVAGTISLRNTLPTRRKRKVID
jgi:hypothetical protein